MLNDEITNLNGILSNMGFHVHISRILGILLKMAIKVWTYTGLVLLSCFLIYYLYGGLFAFALFVFSAAGKKSLTDQMQECIMIYV